MVALYFISINNSNSPSNMLPIRLNSALCIVLLALASCKSTEKDSVKTAKELNDITTLIDSDVSSFLIETIDVLKANLEQGHLATERGSTNEIRNYGQLIVRDQESLINELYVIAKCRKIKLPNTLSHECLKILQRLEKKRGQDFDKKFIKLMTSNHRRDLESFEEASESKDRYIRIFARHYIVMIQEHLHNIQTLDREQSFPTISIAAN